MSMGEKKNVEIVDTKAADPNDEKVNPAKGILINEPFLQEAVANTVANHTVGFGGVELDRGLPLSPDDEMPVIDKPSAMKVLK